jgi:hypothetical protein
MWPTEERTVGKFVVDNPFGTGYAGMWAARLIAPGGNRLLDCQDHLISGAPITKGAT